MQLFRLVSAALLLGLSGCGGEPTGSTAKADGDPAQPPSSVTVITIADFSFSPQSVNIKVGAVVRWVNGGGSTHTTTSDQGSWNSGSIAGAGQGGYGGGGGGGSYSRTFNQVGEFPYHCSIHPGMQGRVVVSQ